jgi:6-phosphogluconolactonase
MRWNAFTDKAQMALAAAQRLEEGLRAGIAQRGLGFLAASGGSTPAPIYDLLRRADLDWARVRVILADERCTPPGLAGSNLPLLQAHLLQGPAAAAHIIPLEAAQSAPWPLDAALFGMGADAHTLSWFPHSAGLPQALAADGPRAAVPIVPDPLPPEAPFARLTLNRAAIADAGCAVLAMTGDSKRAVFEAAMHAKPEDAPVRALVAALGPRLHVMWAR